MGSHARPLKLPRQDSAIKNQERKRISLARKETGVRETDLTCDASPCTFSTKTKEWQQWAEAKTWNIAVIEFYGHETENVERLLSTML